MMLLAWSEATPRVIWMASAGRVLSDGAIYFVCTWIFVSGGATSVDAAGEDMMAVESNAAHAQNREIPTHLPRWI